MQSSQRVDYAQMCCPPSIPYLLQVRSALCYAAEEFIAPHEGIIRLIVSYFAFDDDDVEVARRQFREIIKWKQRACKCADDSKCLRTATDVMPPGTIRVGIMRFLTPEEADNRDPCGHCVSNWTPMRPDEAIFDYVYFDTGTAIYADIWNRDGTRHPSISHALAFGYMHKTGVSWIMPPL